MSTKKILIIDDDARNIFALKAVLKSRGFECLTTGNAKEGLDLLRRKNDVGVVLLDMMMPEMDGYEALAMIRSSETAAGVPVIAVTAQAMVGDRAKCLEAGADEYIAKPVNVDDLMLMLHRFLS